MPTKMPPIGVIPKWLHNEQRLTEITDAIKRYEEVQMSVPQEWIDEQIELWSKILEHRNKQSKQQSNKDWEIVEQRREAKEGIYGVVGKGDWYIHSVRRLSDNEVFTVGDIVNDGYTSMRTEKIQQEHSSIVLVGSFGNIQLRFAKKERQPLFKTYTKEEIISLIEKML